MTSARAANRNFTRLNTIATKPLHGPTNCNGVRRNSIRLAVDSNEATRVSALAPHKSAKSRAANPRNVRSFGCSTTSALLGRVPRAVSRHRAAAQNITKSARVEHVRNFDRLRAAVASLVHGYDDSRGASRAPSNDSFVKMCGEFSPETRRSSRTLDKALNSTHVRSLAGVAK